MGIANFISKNLKQTAVYWPVGNATDDGDGNITHPSAVEISCRWQDVNELVMGIDGEQFLSRAVIYADRELDDHGWLLLGNLPQGADPRAVDGAYRIKKKGESVRLKSPSDEYFKVWI